MDYSKRYAIYCGADEGTRTHMISHRNLNYIQPLKKHKKSTKTSKNKPFLPKFLSFSPIFPQAFFENFYPISSPAHRRENRQRKNGALPLFFHAGVDPRRRVLSFCLSGRRIRGRRLPRVGDTAMLFAFCGACAALYHVQAAPRLPLFASRRVISRRRRYKSTWSFNVVIELPSQNLDSYPRKK